MDENGLPMEIRYSLKRLIQGLGSPRNAIRKSYFASLVSLLRNGDFAFGSLSLEYFKELIDAQLSKFESRGVSCSNGIILTCFFFFSISVLSSYRRRAKFSAEEYWLTVRLCDLKSFQAALSNCNKL